MQGIGEEVGAGFMNVTSVAIAPPMSMCSGDEYHPAFPCSPQQYTEPFAMTAHAAWLPEEIEWT